MVGLLDIAPSTRTVPVGGEQVAVPGVSALGIAYLIEHFPELKEMLGTKQALDIGAETMFKMVPTAIASIIAAGTGYPGDKKAEEVAAGFNADIQLDFLKAILEVTMPQGAGPFFAKLEGVMQSLDVSGKAQALQSPPPSSN